MRKVTVFLSLIMVFALLLAGCGSPPPDAATAVPTEAAAAPAEAAPAEAAPAEAAPVDASAATTDTAAAPAGESAGVIKIATQSPLSGPQSSLGIAIKNGGQLAVEEAAGKIGNFTIELAPFDDQATPDIGIANAKQIVGDPEILCVAGHLNSGVLIPASEEYHSAGLAVIGSATTNPIITDRGYPEVNRIVGRDDVQGVVGADYAFNDLGVKSVYIIHDKTAYGQGVAEFFRTEANKLGMDVLGFEGTEEQSNFDSIITPIIAANPDLVYFGGIYSQGGVLLRQIRDKGLTAAFMGADGLDSSEFVNLAGDAAVDVIFTTTAVPASAFPRAAEFQKTYEDRFGEQFQSYAAYGYDSASICLQAIAQATEAAGGSPTRAEVAAAVRATADFDGITGVKTFNEIGDLTVAQYVVLRITSSDAANWGENEVVKVLDVPAPTK